jgi:drug/metabolite transporter (DMT)-like permease
MRVSSSSPARLRGSRLGTEDDDWSSRRSSVVALSVGRSREGPSRRSRLMASSASGPEEPEGDAPAPTSTSGGGFARGEGVKWKSKKELKAFLEQMSETFPEELDEMRKKVRDDVKRASQSAVLLTLAQACFVGATCLSAQSMSYFSPAQFTLTRSLMSLPLIYLLARTRGETMRELKNVKKRNALLTSMVMILLAACVCMAQMCLAYGLKYASLGNAVVLGQLVPVYSCVIAVFQGIEKPSGGKFAAIGVSVIGTILLLDPSRMWLSTANILLLLRSAFFAAYLAFQESILREYNPITVAVVSQALGALMGVAITVPMVLREHLTAEASISLVTASNAWLAVAGVGALASAAYALTTRAEADTTPVVTACYGSLQPIFAGIIMSAGIGSTAVLARDALASVLILVGSIFAAAKSTLERSHRRVLQRSKQLGGWNTLTGDPTIALPRTSSATSYPAPIDMTLDWDVDIDVPQSKTSDDGADVGGTVIMKGGKVSKRDGSSEGTVRLKRKSRKTTLRRADVVWTVAWAVVLSIAALAGAGLIGWYFVYLYWRFFC